MLDDINKIFFIFAGAALFGLTVFIGVGAIVLTTVPCFLG